MGRRLLWAAWVCALVAAPTGLLVVELVYPDVPSHPPPWPSEPSQPERFAGGLLIAHLVLSPIAAVAVPLLVRWRPHEFTVGLSSRLGSGLQFCS